ncbi:hypothetical protein [Alienimonas sp. DA493]|uniref:hypothetical protein n=1 Tax=Alienimonas sp. DA493 TaxID=3373605 RepID=UPI00375481D8
MNELRESLVLDFDDRASAPLADVAQRMGGFESQTKAADKSLAGMYARAKEATAKAAELGKGAVVAATGLERTTQSADDLRESIDRASRSVREAEAELNELSASDGPRRLTNEFDDLFDRIERGQTEVRELQSQLDRLNAPEMGGDYRGGYGGGGGRFEEGLNRYGELKGKVDEIDQALQATISFYGKAKESYDGSQFGGIAATIFGIGEAARETIPIVSTLDDAIADLTNRDKPGGWGWTESAGAWWAGGEKTNRFRGRVTGEQEWAKEERLQREAAELAAEAAKERARQADEAAKRTEELARIERDYAEEQRQAQMEARGEWEELHDARLRQIEKQTEQAVEAAETEAEKIEARMQGERRLRAENHREAMRQIKERADAERDAAREKEQAEREAAREAKRLEEERARAAEEARERARQAAEERIRLIDRERDKLAEAAQADPSAAAGQIAQFGGERGRAMFMQSDRAQRYMDRISRAQEMGRPTERLMARLKKLADAAEFRGRRQAGQALAQGRVSGEDLSKIQDILAKRAAAEAQREVQAGSGRVQAAEAAAEKARAAADAERDRLNESIVNRLVQLTERENAAGSANRDMRTRLQSAKLGA